VHDESVDGDLSSNPAAPTALALALGGNTVTGTTSNLPANPGERDYITFTIGPGQKLVDLNLLAYSPNNLSFAAFNAGNTSFIPSGATDPFFLAGIHVSALSVGSDLMPEFVSSAVTTNSLLVAELGPGTYCFMIQQTNAVIQSYSLEFVLEEEGVQNESSTWGKVKGLYR
jgi:hypothetical protein